MIHYFHHQTCLPGVMPEGMRGRHTINWHHAIWRGLQHKRGISVTLPWWLLKKSTGERWLPRISISLNCIEHCTGTHRDCWLKRMTFHCFTVIYPLYVTKRGRPQTCVYETISRQSEVLIKQTKCFDMSIAARPVQALASSSLAVRGQNLPRLTVVWRVIIVRGSVWEHCLLLTHFATDCKHKQIDSGVNCVIWI